MSKKLGLNKGRVDLLLSETLGFSVTAPAQVLPSPNGSQTNLSANPNTQSLQQIAITQLVPGKFQPRRLIQEEELKELTESIKRQGVLQPIVVRIEQDQFAIIAGERRWRAAMQAGLTHVPVIVRTMSDEEAMIIALVENIQRENLNPLEEAYALERLAKEFGFTHEETAQAVGKSRATISNLLRLLNLHPEAKLLLERGEISLGHAKVLLALDIKQQSLLAKKVAEKSWSVRETERAVQQQLAMAGKMERTTRPLDPDIARLQRSLSEKVGSPTRILHTSKGRGKIVIKYSSIDELDGILEHIV